MLSYHALQRRASYQSSIGNCLHSPTKMAVFWSFLANFPLFPLISFAKLRFRWLFWGDEQVWTSIGSNVWHEPQMGHLLIDERIRSSSLKTLWMYVNGRCVDNWLPQSLEMAILQKKTCRIILLSLLGKTLQL